MSRGGWGPVPRQIPVFAKISAIFGFLATQSHYISAKRAHWMRICSGALFRFVCFVPHLFRYYLAKSYNIGSLGFV